MLYDVETAQALGRSGGVDRTRLPEFLDLAIAVGGDGTLLSVARAAVPLGIPILGVNFGSLGFLTELQPGEVFEGLQAVLERRFAVEERQALRVKHLRTLSWEFILTKPVGATRLRCSMRRQTM